MILAAAGKGTKVTGPAVASRDDFGPSSTVLAPFYRDATSPPNCRKGPCAGTSDGQDGRPFVRCTRDAPAGSFMIGLVLVTHGRLAVEFRSALEHVVGPQGQIEAVTIGPDDDVEERRKDIIEAVKRVDSG